MALLFIILVCLAASCVASTPWPSPMAWSRLNATVQGRLYPGVPLARPCFVLANGLQGEFNASQCASIASQYGDHFYRVAQFSAYMNTEWETCQLQDSQCLLDSTETTNPLAFLPPRVCGQGSIPRYYIDVRRAEDVKAGFDFSRQTGVLLVVSNTGHDYQGRSSAPNSLALWTHNLKGMSFSSNFVAHGCSQSTAVPAVTFGAGTSQGELYTFAEAMNISIPGGADATVSAGGGYIQGGGHTAFANVYGLAVDRVLEFDVVTPTGLHIKANACLNSDLFYALRGGGGGTFGVVLRVTTKALPAISFPVVNITLPSSDDAQRKLLSHMIDSSLAFAEAGWGGYIIRMIFVNPLMNLSQAQTSMASLQDLVINDINGTFSLKIEPSMTAFFNKYMNDTRVPVGLPFITTSRLIPTSNFRSNQSREELLETLIPVLDNAALPLIFAVTPFSFKDDGGTSVTDVWRNSIWHVTASQFWGFDTSLAQRRDFYHNMSSSMDTLRKITPGSGAYLNEADVLEPDHPEAYWGRHYARLVRIKRKYDPDHILDCWHCVLKSSKIEQVPTTMESLSSAILPPLDGSVFLPDCVDFNMHYNASLPMYVFVSSDGTGVMQIRYSEFGRAADRAARFLQSSVSSDRQETVAIVAICDTLVYNTMVMGCLRAGLVPFPISPRLPADTIAHLLRISECKSLLVTQASLCDLIQDVTTAFAALSPGDTLHTVELPPLNAIYPGLGEQSLQDQFIPNITYKSPGCSDIAIILHSSGSTGPPKAIPITHEVFVKRLSYPDVTELRVHKPDIRFAGMALPPFHQLGLAVQLFYPMYAVKSVTLYPPTVSAENAWPMVPTTENVIVHARATKANAIATVPSYLEVWAQSASDIDFLAAMQFVVFSGGALPSTIGNKLAEAGVKLGSVYGSTEVGGPAHLIPSSASSDDWEWLRFGESLDIRWIHRGNELFELQFLTSPFSKFPVENLADVKGYTTSDLWRKHPTKPGLWKFAGRLDDVIILSSGEKAIPLPMEHRLMESDCIRSAVLFGYQRHQLGLLVEPEGQWEPNDFVEKIWPTVDELNKSAPTFSRVFKDMILVADSRGFVRSPKGTIVRKATLAQYSEDIDNAYSTIQLDQKHSLPRSFQVISLVEWLVTNVAELVGSKHVDTHQNLFHQGVDSIIAVLLRNRLVRVCMHFKSSISLHLNVVAQYPTIQLLAAHIATVIANSSVAAEAPPRNDADTVINTYFPTLRVRIGNQPISDQEVALLVGSTGSLGSHILIELIRDSTIRRIYALNRPHSGSGIDRQLASLKLQGLDASVSEKVVFVDSSYSENQLGLPNLKYEELRRSCTLIIQNGWLLDFNLGLYSFEENIKATRELINFAASTAYQSKFIFISSVSAGLCGTTSETGYGGSKYVAEQLIKHSNLDSISLRFGQLCGDSNTGAWPTNEWFPLLVKSALTLGILPESLGEIDWLPVDTAASLVLAVAREMSGPFRILDVDQPCRLDGEALMGYIRSALVRHLGVYIDAYKRISLSVWVDEVERKMQVASNHADLVEMPISKILHHMRALASQASDARSEFRQTKLGGGRLAPTVGPITESDVEKWVVYWRHLGFI